VIVGWDGGIAAARAVGDAIDLLTGATRVDVVTVTSRRADESELPGFDITQHLARHGIKAEVKRLPAEAEPAATMLAYAKEADADLLVMGGYGHSRLREFVLGGTTRAMLANLALPVLMSH
jgi:nucleotide-binding universal stress UspA family protein